MIAAVIEMLVASLAIVVAVVLKYEDDVVVMDEYLVIVLVGFVALNVFVSCECSLVAVANGDPYFVVVIDSVVDVAFRKNPWNQIHADLYHLDLI